MVDQKIWWDKCNHLASRFSYTNSTDKIIFILELYSLLSWKKFFGKFWFQKRYKSQDTVDAHKLWILNSEYFEYYNYKILPEYNAVSPSLVSALTSAL